MPIGQVAGVALKKATKKLRDKLKKKTTGKPKGSGSALGIVGSASKAGMQSKQGKRRPPRPNLTPRLGPIPGIGAKKKNKGGRGSMVSQFRNRRRNPGTRAK